MKKWLSIITNEPVINGVTACASTCPTIANEPVINGVTSCAAMCPTITNEPVINGVGARFIAPVPLAPFMGEGVLYGKSINVTKQRTG